MAHERRRIWRRLVWRRLVWQLLNLEERVVSRAMDGLHDRDQRVGGMFLEGHDCVDADADVGARQFVIMCDSTHTGDLEWRRDTALSTRRER